MYGSTPEDFHDDGFEGSDHERRIFAEVFFGKDSGTGKKNLATGVISVGSGDNDVADISPCSNSENSSFKNQFSYNLLKEDPYVNENSGGASASGASGWFRKGFSLVEIDDQSRNAKRMKFSDDKPTNAVLGTMTILNSSVLPRATVTSMPDADVDLANQMVTLHLLESSSPGVTSACCLPKKDVKLDERGDALHLDVLECKLPYSDGNTGKDIILSRTAASPVSQDSFATRLLLTSPVAIMGKSMSTIRAENIPKKFDSPGFDALNTSNTDSKKDPRPFLQTHISRLLLAAGWCIERRQRPCRKYPESIYRSPSGRVFREFPKAWRVCGQNLCAGRYDLEQADNGKEWTDMIHFWSDLLYAVGKFKEMEQSDLVNKLAYQWTILDPFVNVVFINRKIGSLRRGEMVKAASSLVIDKNKKNASGMSLESADGARNQSAKVNMLPCHNDSSATKSALAVHGGNYPACRQISVTSQFQSDESIYMADSGGMSFLDTATKNGNPSSRMCEDKVCSLYGTSLSACAFGHICAQLCGYQCNVADIASDIGGYKGIDCASADSNSKLVDVNDDNVHLDFCLTQEEAPSTTFINWGVPQPSGLNEEDSGKCIEVSKSKLKDKTGTVLKKKIRRKSKKISEIKSTIPCLSNDNIDAHGDQLEPKIVNKDVFTSPKTKSYKKPVEKRTRGRKRHQDGVVSNSGQKKPTKCKFKDDDLLVSAIIKNKDFNSGAGRSIPKKKAGKSYTKMKSNIRKDRCRLRPGNQGKLGKHSFDGKWSTTGGRTVLAWLIDTGVISMDDVICYQNPEDGVVIKDGVVSKDGIMCNCCSALLSVSKFKNHAGFKLNHPCLNLFMESGMPFALCQLEAWLAEYKSRRSQIHEVQTDEDDQNDDLCELCGDLGNLLCCDNCPSTFHHACLITELQEVPEGNWYCPHCTCRICGDLVNDKEDPSTSDALKCLQCQHKYHGACCKGEDMSKGVVSDVWFCSGSCQEIYFGLNSRVGIRNHIDGDFCWTLLRCMLEDPKDHFDPLFALKAECNSKLAVGLTIMEECFKAMVDSRTGINIIPHMLYNCGSEFTRLDFHGFRTAILEKDDELVSVASIRVHGITVAEIPFIATCSNYRRQGMCRRLLTCIEEMLTSFKVEKLVISAVPEMVETWTEGFGFVPISKEEKQSLNKINLMIFPGNVLLIKPLYQKKMPHAQSELSNAAALTEVNTCPAGELVTKSLQQSNGNCSTNQVSLETAFKLAEIESEVYGEREIIDSIERPEGAFKLAESLGDQEPELTGERGIMNGVERPEQASPWLIGRSCKVGICFEEPAVESVERSVGNICSKQSAVRVGISFDEPMVESVQASNGKICSNESAVKVGISFEEPVVESIAASNGKGLSTESAVKVGISFEEPVESEEASDPKICSNEHAVKLGVSFEKPVDDRAVKVGISFEEPVDESAVKVGIYFEEPVVESVEPTDRNICSKESAANLEGKNLNVVGEYDDIRDKFSTMSCGGGDPVSVAGGNQAEVACNLQFVN